MCLMNSLTNITSVTYIDQRKAKPTGALILLHGSCGTGGDLYEWMRNLLDEVTFPHIKLIFPTAPPTHYTPLGGAVVPTWYDVSEFTMEASENDQNIEDVASDLVKIIERETNAGIPLNRIIIAGFSRGGGMAYHMGYRYLRGLGGVGVMSSFLPISSLVYKDLPGGEGLPVLFQQHGIDDDLVDYRLAEKTFGNLQKLGVKGSSKFYHQLRHEISKSELEDFYQFVISTIPDDDLQPNTICKSNL